MALALVNASDFSGKTVNQNLYNQVSNMDRHANSKDFSLSNHANAFNRQATGVEVWYYAGDGAAKPVAEKMSKAIADALGLVNRGAKPTTNLYVISNSLSHTLLIEWFFIDNSNDAAKWRANKNKAIQAAIKVMQSYPQYRFKTTHGGHYGYNMMDPGAVGNGMKEALVMQEVNKALLNYKSNGGGNTVSTASNYHTTGTFFECLRDCPAYVDERFKRRSEWKLGKGTEFGVHQIKKGHAAVKVNGGTIYITLDKKWVKKIR